MDIGPAWIALIGTIFGGAGLKMAESWLNRKTVSDDVAAKFRGELSGEILALRAAKTELQARLDEVEKELEDAKEKYWDLREKYSQLQAELYMALQGIQKTVTTAQVKVEELKTPPKIER